MKTDVFLDLLLENFQSLCKKDFEEGKLTPGEYGISRTRTLSALGTKKAEGMKAIKLFEGKYTVCILQNLS